MKNILVLALGHLSNGEITIAIETLRHIHHHGYNLLFISHEWGYNYISSFNIPVKMLNHADPKENKKEFYQILKEFKTDLVLCADVTTMEYASPWSGFSFDDLINLDIPIATFDQYEWESTNFKFDFMVGKAKTVNTEFIKDCDLLIRPCPLNKPGDFDGRIITCRLFGQSPTPPTMTKKQWCTALGIPEDRKIIFIVNSSWEYLDITKFVELTYLIKWMPKIIYHYFLAVEKPLTIIHVGPHPWDFDINPGIIYKYFNHLNPNLYQETEKQADLFCGTNAISITLSKAAYSLTPCILFQNLKVLNFDNLVDILPKMPAWYQEMAREVKKSSTFRIFPWGWSRFLEPVFKDNPYNRTFVEAPVFIAPKCKKILKQYLYDQEAIENLKTAQKEYFMSLAQLPPLESLLEKIG
jgi:hypothetical protein